MTGGEDSYVCRTNDNALNAHVKVCSSHNISTKAIKSIILQVIQAASKSAIEDEEAFKQRLMQEGQERLIESTKSLEKKLSQDKKRCAELDDLIQGLYEANFLKKISDKRFQMLSARYEKEQEELEQAITAAEVELEQFHSDSQNTEHFIQLAKRYTDFSELTTPMLNHFVDKILVHESVKVDGEWTQEVEVYLNYIGKFELPEVELTAEEQEQLAKDKKRRADSRERCKRYRERQRAKKNADTVA
jgi:hypothetical protein